MKNPFSRRAIKEVVADELHQAQLDLLEAQHAAEHYVAEAQMLRGRVERLQQALRKEAP